MKEEKKIEFTQKWIGDAVKSLENIRLRIEALGMNFRFLSKIKTSMNGIERETWLLEYEGSQFVFVAGQRNVTLGWDIEKCPLSEGVLESLREEFTLGREYYEEEMKEMEELLSLLVGI